jgi:mannose-6-phosphate isomerase
VNLQFHKTPYKIEKPWGYELWWGNTEHYLGKLLFVKAGHQSSVHYHEHKYESMYVHAGIMKLEIYEEREDQLRRVSAFTVGPGQSVDIPARVIHSIVATADLDLFESSTPHPDDSIRVLDRYAR